MEFVNLHFLSVTLTFLLLVVLSSASVNVTKLIIQYVSVCGPKLCNPGHPALPVKFNHVYEDHSGCAECSCDDSCWTNGNCCPDMYLVFPTQLCVKNTILQNTINQNEEEKYFMINQCPHQDVLKSNRPPDKEEQLRHLPVTSAKHNFTFRNEAIAKCNSTETKYIWHVGFKCPVLTDFNYLLSFAEIINTAENSQCRISFHPHDHKAARCRTPSRNTVLNKCNMTGHWVSYDEDVDWACGYYGPEVMKNTFRNIFCYICNPSFPIDVDIISKCNTTGLWDVYDQNIELACSAYPMTSRTHPFKNYFCRLCNQIVNTNSLFVDADTVVEVWPTLIPNGSILNRYFFKNIKFNTNFFQRTLKSDTESRDSSMNEIKQDSLFRNGKIVNITNLLFQYYLTTGYYDICNREYLKVSYDKLNSSCVCDARCIFNQERCCVDLALVHSVCVNDLELSPLKHVLSSKENLNSFVTITGCLAKGNNSAYRDRCRNQTNEMLTIFDMLPVENSNTSLVFENVYCAMCGQDLNNYASNVEIFLNEIDPFNVEIVCEHTLPYENDILFFDVIQRAKVMNCRIRTEPKLSRAVCKTEKSSKISQCNANGRTDNDVVWGCENTTLNTLSEYENNYKNVFCKMCTPLHVFPPISKVRI